MRLATLSENEIIVTLIALALLFVLKAYVTNYFFDAFFAVVACFVRGTSLRICDVAGTWREITVRSPARSTP